MSDRQAAFKNPQRLTRWVKVFLYVHIAMSVIVLVSGALEFRMLNDLRYNVYPTGEAAMAAAEASDQRQAVVAVLQLAVFFIAGILILKWKYRANYNARQLGAEGMRFTPGWAVGWYFIPIAYLWKPYQAMKEIWKASASPESWSTTPAATLLLSWWWFFWILWFTIGTWAGQVAMRAQDLNQLVLANVASQFSDFLIIPLSLLLLGIVDRIHTMQMAQAKAQARL